MAIGSGIEWTEATWNPSTGCSKISPGCANCYAEKLSKRLQSMKTAKYKYGFKFVEHSNDLEIPLSWKKPKKIFVNSMSDLFHQNSSVDFIKKCFFTMIKAHWHTFQILTKRPEKMKKFSYLFEKELGKRIPYNIWMGVSVENNDYLWRIDELRKVSAFVKFISFEPLLGPIDDVNLESIDWVIIGGESGAAHRKIEKEWVVDLIKQCQIQNVPVFFKQWGGIRPKSGGRSIDGKTYDGYPNTVFSREILDELRDLKETVYQLENNVKSQLNPIIQRNHRNKNKEVIVP